MDDLRRIFEESDAQQGWDRREMAESNQVPERLFWVKTSFGASAHDVRVHDEDVEYISLSYHEAELERVRRETWDATIEVAKDKALIRMVGGSTGDAYGTAKNIVTALEAAREAK